MTHHRYFVPPWPLEGLIGVHTMITVLLVVGILVYFSLTIDTAYQAQLRNGLPFRRSHRTPLALAEWSIVFWLSGGMAFNVYRLWIRVLEGATSNDPRLLYVEIYRLLGAISVYVSTQYARRWLDKHMVVIPPKEEEIIGA